MQDTSVTFRALPVNSKSHLSRLRWSGIESTRAGGAIRTIRFSRLARRGNDFQTLTVAGANRVSVRVLVYTLEAMMTADVVIPDRDPNGFGVGEKVWLTVKVTPFVPVAKLGGLEWSTDRFLGTATVIDFGERDGNGVFLVGCDEENYTVQAKILSGPSQGETRGVYMTSGKMGKSIIDPGEREFYRDQDKIDAVCRTLKMPELERVAAAMEAKWRGKDTRHYLMLAEHLCNLFDAVDFNDSRRFALAGHYAQLAFPVARKSRPGGELFCLMHQLRDPRYQSGAGRGIAWAQLRREKTARWLSAIHDTAQAIDPNFHINDIRNWPHTNTGPQWLPREDALPPGTTLEAAKEDARIEYEIALIRNAQKSKRLNQQNELRNTLADLWSYGENYIVRAYSKPPGDMSGLKELLHKYHVEPTRAQRIIRRVADKRNTTNSSRI